MTPPSLPAKSKGTCDHEWFRAAPKRLGLWVCGKCEATKKDKQA